MITENTNIDEMSIEQLVTTTDIIVVGEFDIMNLESAGLRVSMKRHSSEELVSLDKFRELLQKVA